MLQLSETQAAAAVAAQSTGPTGSGSDSDNGSEKLATSNFDPAQIRSIQPECLDAMPGPVLEILLPDLSDIQLSGLEVLQGQGDVEDIGGPVI